MAGGGGLGGAPGEAGSAGDSALVAPGPYSGVFRILTNHDGRCMDSGGALTFALHTRFEQKICDDSESQSFTLTHVGQGYYTVGATGSNDCLDFEGSAPENGTLAIRSPCDDRASERWLLRDLGSSTLAFVNQQTSKCVDIPKNSTESGLELWEYECNQTGAQTWRVLSLVPKPLPVVIDEFFFVSVASAAIPKLAPSPDDPTADCNGNRPVNARGDCHSVGLDAFPADATSSGASWLNFPGNWSRFPGLQVAPDSTRVTFQARGELGGEQVTFQASNTTPGAFPGTYSIPQQKVTLDTSWEQYTFDLTGVDYSAGVTVALGWHIELAENTAPLRFYIDDIVWE